MGTNDRWWHLVAIMDTLVKEILITITMELQILTLLWNLTGDLWPFIRSQFYSEYKVEDRRTTAKPHDWAHAYKSIGEKQSGWA